MSSQSKRGAIRIAVIEPSGNLYGSELALLDILTGLDTEMFIPRVYLPIGAAFSGLLASAGIPHEEVLLARSHTLPRWRKMSGYLRLARRLHRQQPDLLYVNEAGILRPMLVIARLLRLPVLCQVQTLEDACWISRGFPGQRGVNAFVSNSDFIAAELIVPEWTKTVLYHGYRPKDLSTRAISRPRAPFRTGILGRIGGSKGHDLLIDALGVLRAEASEQAWEVRFIGATPTPGEWPAWEDRIRSSGLEDVIVPRGYRVDIKDELAELDLLLIPSRAEPFGRILCEAAEAGVPVLLADSGGLGELSHRFAIGERHLAGDAADLARQLLAIRKDYAAVAARFQAGAQRLLSALDYDAYIDVVSSLIRAAAEGRMVSTQWYGRPDRSIDSWGQAEASDA